MCSVARKKNKKKKKKKHALNVEENEEGMSGAAVPLVGGRGGMLPPLVVGVGLIEGEATPALYSPDPDHEDIEETTTAVSANEQELYDDVNTVKRDVTVNDVAVR